MPPPPVNSAPLPSLSVVVDHTTESNITQDKECRARVEYFQNVSDKTVEEKTDKGRVWVPQEEDLVEIQIVNLPLVFTRFSQSLPGLHFPMDQSNNCCNNNSTSDYENGSIHICKQHNINRIYWENGRPVIWSTLAVLGTIILTFGVLYWNYSETEHRKMTKKLDVVLDHWGKKAPKNIDPSILFGIQGGGGGGQTLEGETILGRSGFSKVGDEEKSESSYLELPKYEDSVEENGVSERNFRKKRESEFDGI